MTMILYRVWRWLVVPAATLAAGAAWAIVILVIVDAPAFWTYLLAMTAIAVMVAGMPFMERMEHRR